ncbi:hypothetical protein F4860DRAFT_491566 [Xylaria cubensis]|nr:hypothetical protein F4860DRAFT_491566 [Xylaria cubensis]
MIMTGFLNLSGTARDAIPHPNERRSNLGIDTSTISEVREVTSSGQNAWSRQGGPLGWTTETGHYSWPWGAVPTPVLTLTTTTAYTQLSSTPGASHSSSPSPIGSETRENGVNISGPVAAGIGASASIGLLGIGIVIYLCTKYSRRRRRQSAKGKESVLVEITSDEFWPPYPYSASNEFPVELSAIRLPQEMCAKTRPQEKDSSNRSENAELDEEFSVPQEARMLYV